MRNLTFLFMGVLIMASPVVSPGQTDPHDDPKVIPPSPTVASLMKFADIPVGLYTGVASVHIPLYELKGPHLSLPITLNYHAGGVRVEEQSSWVGLGWALNAGGAISRTTKGLRDEAHGGYITSAALPVEPQIEDFFTEVINGKLDTEPDIFFFNFNGRSGKFYLDKKPTAGNVITGYSIPYQDIRIKCTYAPDILLNFSITTEDGVEYFFDVLETTDSKRYLYDVSSSIAGPVLIDAPPPLSQITSWYLKEIRSPIGGETIVFNYVAEKSKYETTKSGRATYDVAGKTRSRTMSYSEITSNTWRLSTIEFQRIGATVEFVGGDDRSDLIQIESAKPLSQIVIKYGAVPIKRFEFVTHYFTHPMIAQEMESNRYQFKRLRLDKVIEQAGDQSESLPPYVFTYNSIPLPPKNAETQDHWGYYNGPAEPLNIYSYYSTDYMMPRYIGQVNNGRDKFVYHECTGTVTTIDLNGNVYLDIDGVNREPNATSMRAGILTQVRYPTGGTTTLEYGPHYFGYVSDKDTTRNIYNQYVPGAYIERPWQNNPTADEVKEDVFVAPKTGLYKISFEVEFGYKDKDDYENGIAYNRNEVSLLRTDGGHPIIKVYWDYDGSRGDVYIERTPEGTAYAGAVKLSNFATFSEVNFAEIGDTGGDFENYGRRSGRGFMTVRLTGGVSYKFVANRKYNRETYCPSNDPGCITNNNLATINFDRPLDSNEIVGVEKSFIAGGLRVLRKIETPAFGGTPVRTDYSYQITGDDFKPTDRSSGCLLTLPDHTNAEAFVNYQGVQQALDGRRIMDACTENTTYIYTLFSIDSDYVMPLSTTQGSHLSYREVTVSQSGNGYTISKFKSGYDHPDQYPKELTIVIESPGSDKTGNVELNSAYESRFRNVVPKDNRDWERGFETEKIVLDNNWRVLLRETYVYTFPIRNTVRGFDVVWNFPSSISSQPLAAVEYFSYQLHSGTPYMSSKTVRSFTTAGEELNTVFTYFHESDNHINVTRQLQTVSAGEPVETRYIYSADKPKLLHTPMSVFDEMVEKNMLYSPAKTEIYKGSVLSQGNIVNYKIVSGNPVPASEEMSTDGSYSILRNFLEYDSYGNVISYSRTNDVQKTFIWDYNKAIPVASIVNASPAEVAYSSFESDGTGGWSYGPTGVVTKGGKIGEYCFDILSQSISRTTPPGQYLLSYWAKGSVVVAGAIPKASTETPADQNGWKLCEKRFDLSVTSTIRIQGAQGSLIDELRWFPAHAQMTTYSYDPLVGLRWQNDPNNIATEYRYDKFGRLEAIIDHEGNVLKKYTYHYCGQ